MNMADAVFGGEGPSRFYGLKRQGIIMECEAKLNPLHFLQTSSLNLQFTHSFEMLRRTHVKNLLSSKNIYKLSKLLSTFWEMAFFGMQINIMVSLPRKMHIDEEFYI